MKIDIIRQNWSLRGYNFFLWHDPIAKKWPGIIHPIDEIVMLLEGDLILGFPTGPICLKKGQELTVKANRLHTVWNPGSMPNKWCYGYKMTNGENQ
ncbi:hypothetical protein [Serratia sp. PL7]|uniref:hypothetical protein n=1 Tax=Serratia sp. PL7 TaxID=2952201 RepID=UPI001B3C5E6D|nr:hypothetical protein [Serratia sp. PL7]